MTLGATTTSYYYGGYYTQYSSGVITGGNGSNTTSWYAGLGTTDSLDADIRLFSPNLAKNTMFHATLSQAATGGTSETYGGFVNTTTQYTDFTITTSTGTITGGSIRLYGLKN